MAPAFLAAFCGSTVAAITIMGGVFAVLPAYEVSKRGVNGRWGKNHKWRCRGENWENGREKGENWIRNGVECQLLSFILSVFLCFSFCLFLFLSVCLVLLLSLPLSWHQSIHILCSGWSVRPQVCWCNPRKVPVGCHGVHHRGARPPPQPQENGRERCYHRCLTTLLYWVSQKSVYLLLADTASERSDPGPYFSQRSYPDPHF